MNFLGDPVKIECRIAEVARLYFLNLPCHSVNGLIRKVFCFTTAPTSEDSYQSLPDAFVLPAGFIPVAVKPAQQPLEGFLSRIPLFLHENPFPAAGADEGIFYRRSENRRL